MAQVAAYQEEWATLKTNVALICFEGRNFAGPWMRQMDVPFTILIDQKRQAYRAYGLERSYRRSWGLKNLWYYAQALMQERHFQWPKSDSAQLGGDFIVDHNGYIRYAHPSKDPTDRPEIAQILQVLKS